MNCPGLCIAVFAFPITCIVYAPMGGGGGAQAYLTLHNLIFFELNAAACRVNQLFNASNHNFISGIFKPLTFSLTLGVDDRPILSCL